MLKNYNTTIKADLRKKNTVSDTIRFSGISIQSCMVIFAVIALLLLSISSVVVAQTPLMGI